MSISKFAAGVACGVVAAAALTGTAYGATGGTFILGRSNAASTQTLLANSGTGAVLALSARIGQPPLAVSAQAGKATNLNADKLDGLDNSQLQRRVTASCGEGTSIRAIAANGAVTCDPQEAVVAVVKDTIATSGELMGFGSATCPDGYAVTGGGYSTGASSTAPVGVPLYASPISATSGGVRSEFYAVQLRHLDGSPYTAGGIVLAQCAFGFSFDQPSTTALRRSSPSDRQATATDTWTQTVLQRYESSRR